MRKTLTVPALILTALLLFVGCGEKPDPTPAATESAAPAVSETPAEPEYPTFANTADLSEYLKQQVQAGNLSCSFQYTGNTGRINSQTLAEFLATFHVSIERDPENRRLFHITAAQFPGERMAQAHRSGDTSSLTDDELAALEAARVMAAEAQASASTTAELERALFDILIDRTEYNGRKAQFPDTPELPRHACAVGALLDGEANCQGYADAFCVLAAAAGLQAERMYVLKDVDEPYMINLICLDGAWYALDAAHQDSADAHPAYVLFNAGRNLQLVYDWSDVLEYRPISPVRYEYAGHYSSGFPQIGNLTELRDYYNRLTDQKIFDVVFEYTGDPADLEGNARYLISDGNSCTLFRYPDRDGAYCLSIMEHPGYRIADAYFSGDTSLLNGEELLALNTAVRMVEEAKATASTPLELELALHDMLVETAHYDTSFGTTILDVRKPLRHLTAVGALLDGVANCQGYTDAFYALASIAGFQVEKMIVSAYDPLDHITNVICLDGQWYIVDATFNDSDGVLPHFMFNVGKDMCTYYTWEDISEDQPISPVSDEHFYYFMPEPDALTYDSLTEAVRSILSIRRSTGRQDFVVLVRNAELTAADINRCIEREATEVIRWGIMSQGSSRGTAFYILFDPEET